MRNITKFDAEVITDLHPLFKPLLWVIAARSKDDERFILQHVHVERLHMEYCLVCTDGKRMHVSTFDPGLFDDDINQLAPGDYEVVAKASKRIVLAPADDAGSFPDWRALMPADLPVMRDVVTRASISRLGIRSGVLLATDFVIDACGFGHGFGKDDSVHVEFASLRDGGPFLIHHELGKAIVMPMSMDNDRAESEAAATTEIPGALACLTKGMNPGDSLEVSMGGAPVLKIEQTDDGPRVVDAEEVPADSKRGDMMADVKAAAKVLTGKGSREKKFTAINKTGIDWGLPGLQALLMDCGHKIHEDFKHSIECNIFDIETMEAEESQPEGDDHDY